MASSSAAGLRAIHIGPDPQTIGGMQSVLRTIRDYSIGADRITIVPTWTAPSITRNMAAVAHAGRMILAADSCSILHVHLSDRGAYLRDPPLAALARSRGMRVVFTIHGHDFAQFARAHPRIVRAALAPAHHVTCLSDEARDAAQALVGSRVTVLPNPVPIDHDSPPAGETEPVILFAGVVGLRKGVDVLVDAWQVLLDAGVEGRCRIVGPIDDFRPPRLERLTVEGPADPHEIRVLLRSARAVALPSRSEQMPMILAEALAAGRPFVATPVGGTRQLAPSAEMLVPVGDAGALAEVIKRYLTDRDWAGSIGKAAQQFCIQTRSPETISTKLRVIYSECATSAFAGHDR